MSIAIDKNIPIPQRCAAKIKYPFADMDVGDSFFVARPDEESPSRFRNRMQAVITFGKKRTGYFFTSRIEEAGIRIWRIETGQA